MKVKTGADNIIHASDGVKLDQIDSPTTGLNILQIIN